jgi:DNA-binding CsgD family transcriptional regulator
MSDKLTLRNRIGGIDLPDGDNLAIALSCFFDRHMEKPDSDPVDDETGCGKWVYEKTNGALDLIVELVEKENAALRERADEYGRMLAMSAQENADKDYHIDAMSQQVQDLRTDLSNAREQLADIQGAHEAVISDKCGKDEMHCTCVPFLRREIKETKEQLAAVAKERDEARAELSAINDKIMESSRLTDRESYVLDARKHGKDYKSIAAVWGCTRERVRQIESNAKSKIEKATRGVAFATRNVSRLREMVRKALTGLESTLCGPDGCCCIVGSNGDRDIVDTSLITLRGVLDAKNPDLDAKNPSPKTCAECWRLDAAGCCALTRIKEKNACGDWIPKSCSCCAHYRDADGMCRICKSSGWSKWTPKRKEGEL